MITKPEGDANNVYSFTQAVRAEYFRVRLELKFAPLHSGHEGYAILLEEVEEVWQEVKHPTTDENLYNELVQVSAMAMAMAIELESSTIRNAL